MDCSNITFEKDIIIQETYLIGEIIIWPKTTSYPDGFVACNGGSYSKIGEYKPLYEVIGERFGYTTTHFNVPNLNVSVSNIDTPILIKGDKNMTNSGDKELDTNVNDVSGGVNKIEDTILPKHYHNVNFNIELTSISVNAQTITDLTTSSQAKRANVTNPVLDSSTKHSGEGDGFQAGGKTHFHGISYSGSNVFSQINDPSITITYETNANNISGSQVQNVKPACSKIHYIIFTGIKNLT